MRTKLLTWGLAVLGLAALTSSASAQLLLSMTNSVWRFNQTATPLDGTGWQNPGYDDTQAGWESGRGVFAFENQATINPLTNTSLYLTYPGQASQTLTYYFRTHFTVTGDPSTLVMTLSNFIDDGMIVWINGQEAGRFNMAAGTPGDTYSQLAASAFGEGSRTTVPVSSANLLAGDNVIAVEVKQNSATSSDIVFGMDLHGIVAFAPTITQHPASTNVLQGRSTTLRVTANAAPAPTYQWYKDFVLIDGATNATYTITDMSSDKAGDYHVTVTNPYGAVDSASATVGYIADVVAPTLVRASSDALNPLAVTVSFDETMSGELDSFNWAVDRLDGGIGPAITGLAYNSTSNQIIATLEAPLDPAVAYKITISGGTLGDLFGNFLADPTEKRITFPAVFREGTMGYAGTHDAELHSNATADQNFGAAATIGADLDDGGIAQSVIRFDSIFGGGAGQVPLGSTNVRATLRIYTVDPTDTATRIRVLRMLVPWDENTVTWNSMVNGIDETNGVETSVTDAELVGTPDEAFDDIDVTAAVLAWMNGAPNYGWALLASGGNGWDMAASENGTVEWRPTLTVEFTVVEEPCSIVTQPQGTQVAEGGQFTLSVVSRGSDLTYQWYRNNVAILGANDDQYIVSAATPGDEGTYRVEISGAIPPSPCVSANAFVDVINDVTAPTLVSAVGNPDQTTVTIVFSEPVTTATAQNTGSYSLGGLGITSAVLDTAGTTVTLTTAPRVVGNNYTLTITGIRDRAAAANLISPNPTSVQLRQLVRVFGFADTWKYDETGTDLGTGWKETGFNDSAWLSGPGMFGYETTAATLTAFTNAGVAINTPWTTNAGKITFYARKTISWPYNPAGSTFTLNHFTDDGFVLYVNGVEGSRFNMTNSQPILFTDQAVAAAGEGVRRSTNVTGVSCHDNVIAVEVHQNGSTSSDIVFGAELIADVPSFSPCAPESRVRIVRNENGTVTISWTGGGTLVESTSVDGTYNPSANQANPQTITPTGTKFYQSRN